MSDAATQTADARTLAPSRRFWQIHLSTAVIALLLGSVLYGIDLIILLDNGMADPWQILRPGEWLFLIVAETAMIVGVSVVFERAARRTESDREFLEDLKLVLQRGLLRPEDILTISSSGIRINDQMLSGAFPEDGFEWAFQFISQNSKSVEGVMVYQYSVERYAEIQADRNADGCITRLTFRQHITSSPRTDAPSQTSAAPRAHP